MINYISLENWRSHEDTYLEFRKGTNLLIGIMGSGKSSVLDGICFAFFGTFPALEHRRISMPNTIKHDKEYAKIKVGFEWKEKKYEITRLLKKESEKRGISSNAEIRKEGALIEKGQRAVTEYIEQLFQIDYDLFSRAVYSEQNNIDYFLNLDPGKRKQEIDELLGLMKFETARANVVIIINRTKNERKIIEKKFDKKKLEEIKKREIQLEEKTIKLKEKKKFFLELKEKTDSEYQKNNSMFLAQNLKKEKAGILKANIVKMNGMMDQLKEELKKKIEEDVCETTLEEIKKAKTKIEEELKEKKEVLFQLQTKQNVLSKKIGIEENKFENAKNARIELEKARSELEKISLGKKIEDFEKEKTNYKDELLKLEGTEESLINELKKLEEGMKKLNPALAACPLCKTKLNKENIEYLLIEYKKQYSNKKSELERISNNKKEKKRIYSELETKIRCLDGLIEKQHILEKNAFGYEDCLKNIKLLQDEISKINENITTKKQTIENDSILYQQTNAKYKEFEEIFSKKIKLKELEEKTKKIESDYKLLDFSEEEFENIRKKLEKEKIELEKTSLELTSIELQIKDSEELLKLIASEKQELEEMKAEIVNLLKLEEELSLYKNILLETQISLRKEVIEAINLIMNEIWQIVYPYEDYKSLRMTADKKGYSFEIYDGDWRVAELVSGGERASIALTFRIALATILAPHFNMIVLDEPTHNLDKETINMLANTLQSKLPELVEQSFVITHEEGLMGSEFASTYRLSRNKKANLATIVEKV